MAEIQVIGLFHEATPTADTLDRLRELGVPDDKVTVMSGVPYTAEMLGRPVPRGRVGRMALIGALLGVSLGAFLSVGIFLLYPIVQGGQPFVPVPPTLIVFFEATMLGTMWTTFFSMLVANRFPTFKTSAYDPRITEGHIGVLVHVDESLGDQVADILTQHGGHHLIREAADPRPDIRFKVFWPAFVVVIGIVTFVGLLFVYDIWRIPFPSNMVNQDSVAFDQGPRLAAPAQAVPIQGPVLIDDQPASEPVPVTADSLQRGQVLFGLNCVICHGDTGAGNGRLAAYFVLVAKPADLTSATVQNLPDADIFMVITQGFGPMPSLAENLSPQERWDVVNHVRSLKK
jgi:mono/diheme cytochrome c family protein